MVLTLISVGAIILASISGFVGMTRFDAIVRFEYEYFREEWKRDGCPSGYFWMPEAQHFRVNASGSRLAMRLLRHAPSWIAGTGVEPTLRSFRRVSLVFLVSLMLGLMTLLSKAI